MAIEVGNIIDGTVSGITKFGVFVDLGEKQTGLVPVSYTHLQKSTLNQVLVLKKAVRQVVLL